MQVSTRLRLNASGLRTSVRLGESADDDAQSQGASLARGLLQGGPRPEAPRTLAPGDAPADANAIRRARKPGRIRRQLCYERATDPARLWPQGRKREIYEQKSQKFGWEKCQQHLGGPLRL